MNAETRHHLLAINRKFYESAAAAFSASRDHAWPGWERLLPLLDGSASALPVHPLDILDAGCGNARYASFLAERFSRPLRYCGADASRALLSDAHARMTRLSADRPDLAAELSHTDLLDDEAEPAAIAGPFDWVVAFGLLHHVPGRLQRLALLTRLAHRVRPGGHLVFTVWRFGDSPRFARRVVPWPLWNESAAEPIELAQLEPGDQLLRFGDEALPPRYCHHTDDAEVGALVRELPGEVVDDYLADGRSGDLNRYLVLRMPG